MMRSNRGGFADPLSALAWLHGQAVLAVLATLLGAMVGAWSTRETQRSAERIAERQLSERRTAEARRLSAEAYAQAREAAIKLHPIRHPGQHAAPRHHH
jgi:hypothetical protein